MTKIQYTSASPKAGQIEHISSSVAATLIAAGFATAVPFPPRGSKEWLAAIQEVDRMNTQPSQYDTPVPANGVEWAATVMSSGLVRVIKKINGSIWWFDGPPTECPESIRAQFLQLANLNPGANAEALDAAKRSQVDANNKARDVFNGVRNVVKLAIKFLKDSDVPSFSGSFLAGQVGNLPAAEAQKLVDAGLAKFVE
jgi:hypothetical protein